MRKWPIFKRGQTLETNYFPFLNNLLFYRVIDMLWPWNFNFSWEKSWLITSFLFLLVYFLVLGWKFSKKRLSITVFEYYSFADYYSITLFRILLHSRNLVIIQSRKYISHLFLFSSITKIIIMWKFLELFQYSLCYWEYVLQISTMD